MMIEASAAATTYARRRWSASDIRQLSNWRGVLARKSDPDRNAVVMCAFLARRRRIYPSAATLRIEPENLRARGRGRTIQAACPTAWAESIRVTATDSVAALAPEKAPMGAVTPSHVLGPASRPQKRVRMPRYERGGGRLLQASPTSHSRKNTLTGAEDGTT